MAKSNEPPEKVSPPAHQKERCCDAIFPDSEGSKRKFLRLWVAVATISSARGVMGSKSDGLARLAWANSLLCLHQGRLGCHCLSIRPTASHGGRNRASAGRFSTHP